jgi:glycosyltransferase involved in cell wall biosynthesis
MKVNIMTVRSGWILHKNAERMIEANKKLDTGIDMTLSYEPRDDIDINYYVSLDNLFWRKTKAKDVGYFTHLDNNSPECFRPIFLEMDFIVHQCKKYYDMFIELGYPKEKMEVIKPAIKLDMFPLRKIRLGIFQRGGYIGKGILFLKELIEETDLKNFHFVFVGKDWENILFITKEKGVTYEYHTSENYEEYPKLYEKIDYLLIPGLWEGGPMCLLEALAMGIPIIASDVGWVPEFKVDYMFKAGNKEQLINILKKIEEERLSKRKQVENITWENYVKELIKIFEKVI